MINKETIISVYNEKLTLLQWLKSVNKALDEAVLTNVEIAQRGNATFVFVFTFEDGTQVESNEIIVNQGESINGASIVNGHLILSLTNGDTLDAGDVKPVTAFSFNAQRHLLVVYGDGSSQDLGLIKGVSGFSINESQHLIVTYDNGTTEDLGAIFDGNINIDGNFTANSIIENMSGYSFNKQISSDFSITYSYAGVVKNGNKITFAIAGILNITSLPANDIISLGSFAFPASVGSKLYPFSLAGIDVLANKKLELATNYYTYKEVPVMFIKGNNQGGSVRLYNVSAILSTGVNYYFRYEVTFLLSDNLAS